MSPRGTAVSIAPTRLELADIVRASGGPYWRTHRLATVQHRALRAIATCRTAILGGHRETCDRCGATRISYNSCRNRHCPKGQTLVKERWLADRRSELLPIPYFHVKASRDYDPGPDLEKIRVPLLAVNSADDLVNPPELGILEREIKRVPKGRAVVVPLSPDTRGHGTHTIAVVWKHYLEELLAASAR